MTYDCIVIGGGIVGTSSVYHLTMRGKKTLLLDQVNIYYICKKLTYFILYHNVVQVYRQYLNSRT